MSVLNAGRLRHDENGFSLPELITAMAVFGILMTLVLTFVVSFSQTFHKERSAADSTNVAAIGMNSVTKVIRSGTTLTQPDRAIFVRAEREELIMYTYLADTATSPKPIRVRLSIDGDRQLRESRWNPSSSSAPWTFPAVTAPVASSRVVARKIIAPTAAQVAAGQSYLFTYLDSNGNEMATPVPADQRGNIATVRVTMTVQADDTARTPPVTLQNRVGMPNLTDSRLGLNG
ncbi:prepilin-type N-terminal cleavage/methylation domain-containing protein [Salinibacterium sp. GXW1014]|uniref:prepilin-type N-terminal cleavage/methylation domain-containing protein n=1 Tax=Salinibacterium sp. GXW1014 TaxID=3377838 RepID=UPI00383BC44B